FRIASEVLNSIPIRRLVLAAYHPPYVRPPETVHDRRMDIPFKVGVAVVTPVMRRPPQRPLLHGGASQNGEQELKQAAGLVRPMGKKSVIPRGEREHSDRIQRDAYQKRRQTDSDQPHYPTGEVQHYERNRFPRKPVRFLFQIKSSLCRRF